MTRRRSASRAIYGVVLAFTVQARAAPPEYAGLTAPGIHTNVRFGTYPELASSESVAERTLSPLSVEVIRRHLRSNGTALNPQLFKMGEQSYLVYVPNHQPPSGYGILVFVPPWPTARIPAGWQEIFDRHGVILISADNSGNDSNTLGERIPAALAGYASLKAQFAIDPKKVIVGGFSGGSRVAMRIALAYPDIFWGLLLNAGSDPVGEVGTPIPGPELMRMFQTRTLIAFVTGDQDDASQSLDDTSQASLAHWCVRNVLKLAGRGRGHEPASQQSLDQALRVLLGNPPRGDQRLTNCQAQRKTEVAAALARARTALEAGRRDEARRMIIDIDRRFGGYAGPDLIGLADDCACELFDRKAS